MGCEKMTGSARINQRVQAYSKGAGSSLVVIEPPTLPETAEFPRRLYELSTLLLLCLAVFGIGHLAIATVREHRD